MAIHFVGVTVALLLECGSLLAGCTQLKPAPNRAGAPQINLEGVWNGLSVNDCSPVQVDPSRCGAVEQISLTLLHHDKRSWGFYGCAPGNAPCYDAVSRGEVKYLQLNGRMLWFRVMRDDHSSCLFNTIPTANRMNGQFWCFEGDALTERGLWQVERSY